MKRAVCMLSAVAAAGTVLPAAGFAAPGTTISGFADVTYTVTDDTTAQVAGKSPTEGKFGANAEVDVTSALSDKVTVRMDADLDLVTNAGANVAGSDSGRIEQAFFAYTAAPNITLLGGVFNNPIGFEQEDAPDLYQISHGQIWAILDGQTALDGNNVAGVAAAADVGAATVTVGFLNDLLQSNDENSIAVAINASPVENLDLEFGYVTQAAAANAASYGSATVDSAEDWWDVNVTYRWKNLLVAAEYLTADKVVDSAYMVMGNCDLGNGFGLTARFDNISFQEPIANVKDTDTTTVAGYYALADNLTALLEWRTQGDDNDTNGVPGGGVIADGDLVQLEFVATF